MDIYNEIQLEFSRENVQKVIEWGASPDSSPHSHQAIASWCERFWNKYCDIDAPEEIEEVMPLLAEIETEWDVYVAHYKEQHPNGVTSSPRLPPEYFNKWLSQANA
jgi:uncharacterized short protein YbdD (DUF466 family)